MALSKVLLEILAAVAAMLDLRNRRIPNWLTFPGALVGVAVSVYESGWAAGLKSSVLGLLLAFAVYALLFALRAMGGGDVKLMAAVGAFVGPERWLWIFAITSVVGGVFAIFTLLTRGGLGRALANIGVILRSLARGQAPHAERPELDVAHVSAKTLPHGAAIAVGVLIYALWLDR